MDDPAYHLLEQYPMPKIAEVVHRMNRFALDGYGKIISLSLEEYIKFLVSIRILIRTTWGERCGVCKKGVEDWGWGVESRALKNIWYCYNSQLSC